MTSSFAATRSLNLYSLPPLDIGRSYDVTVPRSFAVDLPIPLSLSSSGTVSSDVIKEAHRLYLSAATWRVPMRCPIVVRPHTANGIPRRACQRWKNMALTAAKLTAPRPDIKLRAPWTAVFPADLMHRLSATTSGPVGLRWERKPIRKLCLQHVVHRYILHVD